MNRIVNEPPISTKKNLPELLQTSEDTHCVYKALFFGGALLKELAHRAYLTRVQPAGCADVVTTSEAA